MTSVKREKILIGSVLVILHVAVFKYGYLNLRHQETDLQVQAAETQTQLTTQTNELNQLVAAAGPTPTGAEAVVVAQYRTENNHFASFTRKLVTKDEFPDLQILRIATEGIEKEDGFSKVRYSLFVKASYLAIGALIEKLENSPLMVDMRSIDIARDGSDLQLVIGKIELFHYVTRE